MFPDFTDILDIRTGTENMTVGHGETRVEPIATPDQWHQKAAALRDLYMFTLGHRPHNYDQPLDLRIESEVDYEGVTRRTVSYNIGPNERIKAEILLPKNGTGTFSSKLPALLTIHPTNDNGRFQSIGLDHTEEGLNRAYGLELAQRGYVTISFDLDATNERLYPGRRAFDNVPFYGKCPDWSGRGKDLYDTARAIDVLELTPEVDATRIGSIGHSQGGGLTTDIMAIDPRVKVGVNNCGDWPFRASKNPYNRCRTGWWIGIPQLRSFALTGKLMPIDLHEKLALAAPRPQLLILSLVDFGYELKDEPYTRPVAERLHAAAQSVYNLLRVPDKIQMHLHTEGHCFLKHHRDLAYAFLSKHLKD